MSNADVSGTTARCAQSLSVREDPHQQVAPIGSQSRRLIFTMQRALGSVLSLGWQRHPLRGPGLSVLHNDCT